MSKGLAQIMKQAQQMQQKMARLQEEASQRTAEASVGGGAVTAVVNGKNQVLSLSIRKEAVDPEDVEMLQDLVVAAVNEALKKVQSEVAVEMEKITGGMSISRTFLKKVAKRADTPILVTPTGPRRLAVLSCLLGPLLVFWYRKCAWKTLGNGFLKFYAFTLCIKLLYFKINTKTAGF